MKKTENDARLERLMGIVHNLPESPGSYQYLDEKGTIIYVGKAKNLKRRVSSYFNKEQQSNKTRLLVSKIMDIKYIVVKTEEDALLLENNLIKRYKPRYNVLLKDDKTYPSIAITNEEFPRIFKVRQRSLRGATYYGPYSHVPTMYALLDLCKKLYHPRSCRLPLTKPGIEAGRFKVCLDYHIHNCQGPCEGHQSREDYQKNIAACREILKGNTTELARNLREEMMAKAEALKFEEAQVIKQQLDLIENFRAKSEIVSSQLTNIDVFSIEAEESVAYINYLHVKDGCINQAFTFEYRKKLEETAEELLVMGITEMRTRYGSRAHEILVPFPIELPLSNVEVNIPQRGEKRKLLELSLMNVKQYRFDRLKQAEKLNPEQKSVRLMKEIQQDLGLPRLPLQIELFDNSHIQGSDAVAACVVFERLKPCKKAYRKYILHNGPDDYASMREVVFRRYSRLQEEGGRLPDLIIADGGEGQMNVIRQITEGQLGLDIPIAGLAKDSRHRTRELLFGTPPQTVGLKPDSELFKLLTHMQDEVHRFAISFHRDKRSARQTASELDQIKGIGPATKSRLLRHFGSVKRIKTAEESDFKALLGEKRGARLYELLHAATAE